MGPGVHFVACFILCQQRAPPHVEFVEEGHMVGTASLPSMWSHLHSSSDETVKGRCLPWGRYPCVWSRTEYRGGGVFFFFFVNKSRILAKVIYVHTEVLGYVPNSAAFVNMNEPFGDKSN